MRKIVAYLAALCLLLCAPAGRAGEAADITFEASVAYTAKLVVNAPYSGKLASMSARAGDRVSLGDELFSLDTLKLYAPASGTVVGVFAEAGDDGKTVQDASGAILYIEQDLPLRIASSLSGGGAYDSWDNKLVHIGERVYLRSRNNKQYTGTGVILTTKDTGEYTVKVTDGNLRYSEPVSVYRSADFNDRTRIGIGDAKAQSPAALNCEGTILRVAAQVGGHVEKGELLVEYAKDAARDAASASVFAPCDAIVVTSELSTGEGVEAGKAVVTLAPLSDLMLAAKLTEYEIMGLELGGRASVAFGEGEAMEGLIRRLSLLPDEGGLYEVWIECDLTDRRVGTSAIVTVG